MTKRLSRTLVSAIGLAVGVGLVMGIVGVSNGLNNAEGKDLSPLSSVGTDIIVTRTVDAVTSISPSSSTTTSAPSQFFRARGQLSQLNSTDQQALLQSNSSVLTDLSKLGPAGTNFTYDFFAPGTLITFPSQATSVVQGIKDVTSAVPALSMQAIHESGTVPKVVDTFQTGSQSLNVTTAPPPMTQAQRIAMRACLQNEGVGFRSGFQSQGNSGSNSGTSPTSPGGGTPTDTGPRSGGSGLSQAFLNCMPASYQQYETQVVIPSQTITRVLNPPSTNTSTNTYTVAGIDVSSPSSGIITTSQLTSGHWFDSNPKNEILVDSAYASSNHISLNQSLTIDKETFKVIGLVNPTLTGNTADIYFDLSTIQSLASNSGRINEILVKVANANEVNQVASAIKQQLPGAQVLTSASLADQVSGSLQNAKVLATNLGTVVAIIVLLAAFLIALLLTLSNITKRYREIGTLRAIGWRRKTILSQILLETIGIGVIGAALGVLLGFVATDIISALLPPLTSTTSGLAVGASSAGTMFHQTTSATSSTSVKLSPSIGVSTVIFGIAAAIVGSLIAGIFGGIRAARLQPAQAFRDIG